MVISEENNTASLYCNTSEPVTWYYMDDTQYVLSRSQWLIIKNIQKKQEGTYVCKVLTKDGSILRGYSVLNVYSMLIMMHS